MAKNYILPREVERNTVRYSPQWFIILGMRSNGKSTAVKHLCVKNAYLDDKRFIYIRRYKEDMKQKYINSYFANVNGFNVPEITDGTWEGITARGLELYFYRTEDKKKILSDNPCGYFISLSDQEHIKSLNFPNCTTAIFEEFVTMNPYLDDETTILFNCISSVFRNNEGCVYMVANTISTICPYFREFKLTKLKSQKIDTIDIYKYDNTTIAVWLTAPLEEDGEKGSKNKMYFGQRSRMINAGEWQRTAHRKPLYKKKEYDIIYTMVLSFDGNRFLMEFRRTPIGGHVWFISKKTSEIQPNTRIISNEDIENEKTTIGFIPLNEKEAKIFKYIKDGKVTFTYIDLKDEEEVKVNKINSVEDLNREFDNIMDDTIGGLGNGTSIPYSLAAKIWVEYHDTIVNPADGIDIIGYPTNFVRSLSNASGFIQTAGFQLGGVATAPEKDAVNALMDSGVYLE